MKFCVCGCGRPVRKKYAVGHHRKGTVPWNKGLTKESSDKVAAIAAKVTMSLTGKPRSRETIEKQRASIRGKNKGRVFGQEFREMRRRIMLGTRQTEAQKKKMSDTMKRKIASGEFFPIIPPYPYPKPNKVESHLLQLLNKYFPGEYEYTGDGTITIDRMIPDFTNRNGRKEVIELFGDYWHRGQDPEQKRAKYAAFGFACLVIWESELKDEISTINKVRQFRKEV